MFGRTKEEPSPQTRVQGTTSRVSGGGPAPELGGDDRGSGPREGLILLLFALLTMGAIGFVLAGEESEAVDDPAEKAARGEIAGLDEESLLQKENLGRALDEIGGGAYPLVTNLRVAADRVNATARDREGIRRVLTVDPAFDVEESDFGTGLDDALEPDEIDAGAPERMVRAVVKRTGVSAGDVDYVTTTVSSGGSPRTWYMALKGGPVADRQWIAEADGSDLRKPGELSKAQKAEGLRQRRAAERQQRRQMRQLQRRRSCLLRARDAEAAGRCLAL